ncbi:MAG: heme lyase CcmF/NrfE family subunit [Chloroflexaceae bacterium]|nr:heme lyase CcmF/NrfE family subunit [Chloroflexaceae bacterium]
MYFMGTILLMTSLVLALLSIGSYVLVMRGRHAALDYGRAGVLGSGIVLILAWLLLVMLFLARRFDIQYVYDYSSSELDTFFTIAASWAGQSGSFAFWAMLGGIVAMALVYRSRHFEPYVLAVLMVIQAGLIIFTLILNPFQPTVDPNTGAFIAPPDGSGLNALLHNFWMIIHPPVLFLGFALTAVPFAFALGSLLRYDYDTWVTRALPWTVAAWSFLGLALMLGGYWAYETLGWGGYWGWDPVENASLVPWLVLTALLHGMVMQRSQGTLRRTNMMLAIAAYVLVFFSTFLTRSGVLANFSVHSFVAEGMRDTMLVFLALIGIGSLVILALRWRDIPSRPLSDKLLSRESFFALAMLSLVILALVIGIGTSMPLISALPGVGHTLQDTLGNTFELDDGTAMGGEPFTDGRFSLAPSFYQTVTPPLGLVVVILMIAGPLLGWRDTNQRHLLRALRWPAILALLATCGAILLGVTDFLSLAYVGLGSFALGSNVVMIMRTIRSGWLRIGGYLAHVGLAVMLIGIVGSTAYASPDERLALTTGETISLYDHAITFQGWKETPDGRGVFDLTIQHGDETFQAHPEMYLDEQMGGTIQNPSIKSYLTYDLYIAPAEYVPEYNPAEPVLGPGDTVEMGPYELTFTEFDIDTEAMMANNSFDVGAILAVTYNDETTTIVPRVTLIPDPESGDLAFIDNPATLPGGHVLSMTTFDPNRRLILLNAQGLELPIQPERAVITVSTKPLVQLVWIGMVVGVLGGLIAVLRRYLEAQARLRGEPVRLPRGLAGLWR